MKIKVHFASSHMCIINIWHAPSPAWKIVWPKLNESTTCDAVYTFDCIDAINSMKNLAQIQCCVPLSSCTQLQPHYWSIVLSQYHKYYVTLAVTRSWWKDVPV